MRIASKIVVEKPNPERAPQCYSPTGAPDRALRAKAYHQCSRVGKIMAATHPSGVLVAPTTALWAEDPGYRRQQPAPAQALYKAFSLPPSGWAPVSPKYLYFPQSSPQTSNRDRERLQLSAEGSLRDPAIFLHLPGLQGLIREVTQLVRLPVSTTKLVEVVLAGKTPDSGNDLFRMSVGSRIPVSALRHTHPYSIIIFNAKFMSYCFLQRQIIIPKYPWRQGSTQDQ